MYDNTGTRISGHMVQTTNSLTPDKIAGDWKLLRFTENVTSQRLLKEIVLRF